MSADHQRTAQVIKVASLCIALLVAASSVADVSETFDLETYEVDQRAGEALLAAINRQSPLRRDGRIFHGYTKWHVRWNFRWDNNVQGRCAITEVKTTLSVVMQLPELDDSTLQGRSEFDGYLPALREHEDGHHRIGAQAARRIDQAIRTLQPMRSCQALEAEANRRGYEILKTAVSEEDDYDVDTRHGCSQGACL